MASAIAKLIQAAANVELAGRLKQDGYRKSAMTWRRVLGDLMHVVNVQSSQGNVGEQGQFTLNLGVYVPEIARLRWGEHREAPAEYHCHLRSRIGELIPGAEDRWWQIDGVDSVERAGREAAAAFNGWGTLWLSRLTTIAAVAAELAPLRSVESAAAALLVDRAEASRRIAAVIAECPPSATGLLDAAVRFQRDHQLG